MKQMRPFHIARLASIVAVAALAALAGCGEQATGKKPIDFASMADDAVKNEVVRLRGDCRQSQGDPDKPASACSQLNLAESAAETKGWCWGPLEAANTDMSWLRCEDDVTRTPQAQRPWYVVTKSGACREAELQEAISKVLAHDGQWNVKTWFAEDGTFTVSSRTQEGNVASVQLFRSCGAALMTHVTNPERPDALAIAAPLGFSPKEAAEYFGFGDRSCAGHTFGRSMGCNVAFTEGMNAPISLTGGFTPCAPGRTVQFDFEQSRGMVGVTCAASAETQAMLRSKLNEAFGEPKILPSGSLLWTIGDYSVRSSQEEVFGNTLRRTSVLRTAW